MAAGAAEFHVSPQGDDGAAGNAAKPWRTIQRAARVAAAGDVVTIHAGVYREWVKPAQAGRADAPIVYRAAPGEKVVITGADEVRGWTKRPAVASVRNALRRVHGRDRARPSHAVRIASLLGSHDSWVRPLAADDVLHYKAIVLALIETAKLMARL